MQQKIAEYIKKFRLIKPNSKLIIALSGGADSVVLTHILHKMGYNCIAAHCNFELRDAESDRDELFVRQLCNVLNIPLEIIHFNTNEYAAKQKFLLKWPLASFAMIGSKTSELNMMPILFALLIIKMIL